MRRYIIVALVLCVLGVGISLLLIPTEDEVVQLQQRDVAQIDLGNIDLQAEYTQGRRSFPIVNGLVEERVAAGDRPAAIALLEEYVAETPNDVNARKALAEQYQLAGDMQKYNEQLEQIAIAEPTEKNLKVLSDIYNSEKNYEKQAETLKQLIMVTNSQNPQYFVDLATIQSIIRDNEGQIATIAALRQAHPTYVSYPMTRIYVDAMARTQKLNEAQQAAEAWMQSNPEDAAGLGDLMNIIHYTGGSADRALQLSAARLNLLPKNTELVKAYVNANLALDKSDVAFDTMRQIEATGTMPPELYGSYLDLAIKRSDTETSTRIIASLDPALFNEDQALNLIELTRVMAPESTFKALVARFNAPEAYENKPTLASVVSIITNNKDQDERIATALATQQSDTQRMRLGQACARAQKNACFDSIVQKFPDVASMTPVQIEEFAELHLQAGRGSALADKLTALYATSPQPHIHHQQLRLAASAGRNDIFDPWLATDVASANDEDLREYFYIANNREHLGISSKLAEALYQRAPTPENRSVMIASLLKAGNQVDALPYLREQAGLNRKEDGAYLSTLSALAKKDKTYKQELLEYAERSLKDNQGASDQQLNYAYILINNGKREVVKPIARNKAKTEGGEWRKMMAQLNPPKATAAAAPKPLTTEQMLAKATDPYTNLDERKQIGFNLLESGKRAEAAQVFQSIAAHSAPNSQEMKDLLYVWGGKLNANHLAWITARARTAPVSESNAWSEIVHNNADDGGVMRYATSAPNALHYRPLRQRFFRLLAEQGDGSNFTVRMRSWMQATTDTEALHDYARTALDFEHRALAKETYQRIVTLDPNNKYALNQLGTLKFTVGQFTASEDLLTRAVSLPAENNSLASIQADAQARFFRAELLKRNGNLSEARSEYSRVIELEQQAAAIAGGLSSDGKTRVFSSLFHVGRAEEGMRGFENMLRANPRDRGALADYLSVLIEYDFISKATAISNQYGGNSRIDKFSALEPLPQWLASTKWAQEKQRAAAAQGYELRFVPTAGTQYRLLEEDRYNRSGASNPNYVNAPGRKAYYTAPQQQAYTNASTPQTQRHYPASKPQTRYQAQSVQETSGTSQEVAQARQQELRLQLLYARIEQESGQDDLARQRLAQLAKYYPNEPQLMAYQANVERTNGNPIGALRLLDQARALSPENEDFGVLEREIRRTQNTNFVRADHENRSFGKNNEHITTLTGATRVTDRTELGFVAQNNAMRTKNFRNGVDGRIGEYDTTRQNAEVYAAYYYEDGDRLKGSIYGNNETMGFGSAYGFNNSIGRTEGFLEFRRPYNDFVEAAFESATRSRIGLRHNATITPTVSFGLETAINSYDTRLENDVVKSGLVRMNLVKALRQAQPYLAVGYGFDGEYLFGDQEFRLDRFNNVYKLLPLVTREVHALTGILQHDLTDSTHMSLFGGWTIDRLGEQGPVVEGRLTQDVTESLEAGIRARYGRQTNDSDNNATHLGGHVQYKF